MPKPGSTEPRKPESANEVPSWRSEDRMFIQFDHGAVWQRDIGLMPPRRR